jgi:hypothetical protein
VTAVVRQRAGLSALDRAIVESVAYSDVFDFAVTAEEIRRSLPVSATVAEVEVRLNELAGLVSNVEPYYTLVGRETLVRVRQRRAMASRRLMRLAGSYGRVIGRLPFVRMVAVSGSLAVENADAGDDLDYFIVTAPRRVWLARALTIVVVRVARLRGLELCPNYVLAETALELPDRDAYTARELMQMRPISGLATYGRMIEANRWARDLLPNWHPSAGVVPGGRSLLQRAGDALVGGRAGDAIERWLLQNKGRQLAAHGSNGEVLFNETVCKGHFDGHRARLEEALAERLLRLGVEP